MQASPKARDVLGKGLIYSLPGTCLLALQPRTTYVLTGHVEASKPWTNLCHYAQPLRSLAPKMRKGFRMLYRSGCDCPVRQMASKLILYMNSSNL